MRNGKALLKYFLTLTFLLLYTNSTPLLAEPDRLVKISEWGSDDYQTIIKVNDLIFAQQNGQPIIDVIDESKSGDEALIKKINLSTTSKLISAFNNYLVVSRFGLLDIYDVSDLSVVRSVFQLPIDFSVEKTISSDSRLIVVDRGNNIYTIDYISNEFVLNSSLPQKLAENVSNPASIGLEENVLHILYHVLVDGNQISHSALLHKQYLVKNAGVSDLNQDQQITFPQRDFVPYPIYLSNGSFALAPDINNPKLTILSSTFKHEIPVSLNQYCCSMLATHDLLWLVTDDGTVQIYDVSVPENTRLIVQTKSGIKHADNLFMGAAVADHNDLYLIQASFFKKITLTPSSSVTVMDMPYQSGDILGAALDTGAVVSFTRSRINVLDKQDNQLSLLYSKDLNEILDGNSIEAVSRLAKPYYVVFASRAMYLLDSSQNFAVKSVTHILGSGYATKYVVEGDNVFVFQLTGAGELKYSLYERTDDSFRFVRNYYPDLSIAFSDLISFKVIDANKIAFIARNGDNNYLNLLNLSLPETPVISSSVKLGSGYFSNSLAVKEDVIYTTDMSGELKVFNVTDNGTLQFSTKIDLSDYGVILNNHYLLEPKNDFLFIVSPSNNTTKYIVFSLKQPSHPDYLFESNSLWGGGAIKTLLQDSSNNGLIEIDHLLGRVATMKLNGAPKSISGEYEIDEDTQLVISTKNLDPDSDPITVTLNSYNNGPLTQSVVFDEQRQAIIFTPKENMFGNQKITVFISDKYQSLTKSELSITINPVNDAPLISPDTQYLDEDTQSILPLIDPEDHLVNVKIEVSPEHGSVSFNSSTQQLIYTPDANYFGEDSSAVRVEDTEGAFSEGVIHYQIRPLNDLPELIPEDYSLSQGGILSGQLQATDADQDSIWFSRDTDPANGVFELTSDGKFTYTPNVDFNGDDFVVVGVQDGHALPALYTLTFNVKAKASAPPAQPSKPENPSAPVEQPNKSESSGGGSVGYLLFLLSLCWIYRFNLMAYPRQSR